MSEGTASQVKLFCLMASLFQSCFDGYECVKITCLITNLMKHDQEVINVTVDIQEKSLAKAKVKCSLYLA